MSNEIEEIADIKQKAKTIKRPEKKVQEFISPSSINLYLGCSLKYYYRYIEKIPELPSIHLVKGTIVHRCLEDFFRGYSKDLEKTIINIFEKVWNKYYKDIRKLELTPKEVGKAKIDCFNMLKEFYHSFIRKMNALTDAGKAENEQHAFYLIKPKFRELFVQDRELHCRGFIDRISEDWDGFLTLADYKTSSKYGTGFPEEYKLQLSIYALLYKNQEKRQPDFVAVNFLRYGEEYLLEVTPSMLKYARNTITEVYSKTRSMDIKDYPKKESSRCRWCPFTDKCSGEEKWKSDLRVEKIKEIIKEK